MSRADQPVPVGDLEVAQRVAAGAREGGRADREPTLEQLLAAFGEPAATPEARRRARSALRMAGVTVLPDLLEAEPGARVRLLTPTVRSGPAPLKAVLGVLGLVAVIAGVVLAASLGGDDAGDQSAGEALPAGTTAGAAPAPVTVTVPATTPATDPPRPATTATEPPTPSAAPEEDAEEQAAAERRRERRAAERRRRIVTVRLTPAEPTYLCADRGPGTEPIFAGTLTTRRTFRGRRIRLNVGLASTRVQVNGEAVPLSGSPAGLDITRARQTPLPLGARPSC